MSKKLTRLAGTAIIVVEAFMAGYILATAQTIKMLNEYKYEPKKTYCH